MSSRSSAAPALHLGTAPARVHVVQRAPSQEFDTTQAEATRGQAATGRGRKDSLESTRSFYNLPSSSSLPAVGVGRQSPTPSSSSFYHQRPGARLSAGSLTSPGPQTSALPTGPSLGAPGRQPQSAFTSGVLPARGFFAPQRPGDARRLADPSAAALRTSESILFSAAGGGGGGVEMTSPSRFDPKPLAATTSETSFGQYASSRQPSEDGSIDPSSTRELRAAPSPSGVQTGSVAYKGSREPLLDYPVSGAGPSGSPRLHLGASPKLSLGGGFGTQASESRKGSAATAGIGGSPYLPPAASGSPRPGTQSAPPRSNPVEKPTKRVRAYTLHNSANAFALGGRLVTGGDSSPFPLFASILLEVGVGAVWIGTTGVGLWQNGVRGDGGRGGIVVVVIFLWLWGISLGAMLGTAFRDPGILPRNLDPSPPRAPTESTGSLVPLPRDLRVRAGRVIVKYCETCRIYRPPRASHCRICDNCVDGIDHHCAYLHNCVGRNNYTSFIAFLVFTVLSLAWVAIWSAVYLWRTAVSREQTFRAVLGDEAGSGVVFCLSLVLLFPVGSLMSYHVWLMLHNSTTIEEIRRTAQRSMASTNPAPPSRLHKLAPCLASVGNNGGAGEANPFTYGRWRTNFSRALCRPRIGSWMAFAHWVEVPVVEEGETWDKRRL